VLNIPERIKRYFQRAYTWKVGATSTSEFMDRLEQFILHNFLSRIRCRCRCSCCCGCLSVLMSTRLDVVQWLWLKSEPTKKVVSNSEAFGFRMFETWLVVTLLAPVLGHPSFRGLSENKPPRNLGELLFLGLFFFFSMAFIDFISYCSFHSQSIAQPSRSWSSRFCKWVLSTFRFDGVTHPSASSSWCEGRLSQGLICGVSL
jgi:hypothetical protein